MSSFNKDDYWGWDGLARTDNIKALFERAEQAEARITELEEDLVAKSMDFSNINSYNKILKQRANELESQVMFMRNCGNCGSWHECWPNPDEVPGMEICHKYKFGKINDSSRAT